MKVAAVAITVVALTVGGTIARTDAPLADIHLPAPRMEGGKPLLTALKERQTCRAFSDKPLSMQVISDLLWAAFGINRPDSGKRTAPSARNWQEIEVYAVLANGAYRYDAPNNLLRAVATGDLRALTGKQPYVAKPPLNLVYVVNPSKIKAAPDDDTVIYYSAGAGFISQNVYLFCASEGLGTVVRGLIDRQALAEALKLPENFRILLAQTVGYPEGEN
ncbi:MAG TPA: SagB/ThcOx family dehydrogenase [Kiritimatiellia bacterium]|nr:SagB/ThcOx family dehydrogenase [Kiritimatiellia bacterium]HRU70199.1 SagB/ThcOx family dehydrogenase [Kiritimatiellia bacterium]